MSNHRSRLKVKGRAQIKPFLALDRAMLRSEQWAQLTPFAKALFLDLAVQYNGSNNGDLCAAWSVMELPDFCGHMAYRRFAAISKSSGLTPPIC